MSQRCLHDIHGLMFRSHGEYRNSHLITVDLQLLNGSRTVNVAGHQKTFLTFILILSCQLGHRRGLTCTLQAAHHDDRLLVGRTKLQLRHLGTHKVHQFFLYDLDHHLAGIQALHDLFTHGTFADRADKLLYNLEVNVRLQQRTLHFLHGLLYVIFLQKALAPQLLKYIL